MWWRTDEEIGREGGRESDQGCVWPGGDPHLHLPTNQCLRPSILLTHNHTACSASPAPSSHPSIPDIYSSIPSHILHANHLLLQVLASPPLVLSYHLHQVSTNPYILCLFHHVIRCVYHIHILFYPQ